MSPISVPSTVPVHQHHHTTQHSSSQHILPSPLHTHTLSLSRSLARSIPARPPRNPPNPPLLSIPDTTSRHVKTATIRPLPPTSPPLSLARPQAARTHPRTARPHDRGCKHQGRAGPRVRCVEHADRQGGQGRRGRAEGVGRACRRECAARREMERARRGEEDVRERERVDGLANGGYGKERLRVGYHLDVASQQRPFKLRPWCAR